MKAKEFEVLEMAIDQGVNYGFVRAYKYNDAPDEQHMRDAVKAAVMDTICEWFSFDGDEDARQF